MNFSKVRLSSFLIGSAVCSALLFESASYGYSAAVTAVDEINMGKDLPFTHPYVEIPQPPSSKDYTIKTPGDFNLSIGGYLGAEVGVINQEDIFKQTGLDRPPLTSPPGQRGWSPQSGFETSGNLNISASKRFDDQEYGAVVQLNANPSPTSGGNTDIGSMAYLYGKGKYGLFEAGSSDGAENTLVVSPRKIARATGGIDSNWTDWIRSVAMFGADNQNVSFPSFIIFPYLPYTLDFEKSANKFTYYTPIYNGFSFGLSYVPDVNSVGTRYVQNYKYSPHGYGNVWEGGVKYETSVTKDLGVKVSLTGQLGDAKSFTYQKDPISKSGTWTNPEEVNSLGSYELAGQLSYRGLTFAASYSNWGNSGTLKNRPLLYGMKKQGNFWTAGVAYVYNEKLGVSVTYMASRRAGFPTTVAKTATENIVLGYDPDGGSTVNNSNNYNGFQNISVGVDYQVIPGLMPYLEWTGFRLSSPIPLVKTNKGGVIMCGAKIKF